MEALAAAPDGDGPADKPGASAHATATAAPPADDGSEQVTVRGAVLLRVGGATPLDEAKRAELPVELRAAVDEPRVRAGAALWGLLREARVPWRRLAAGVALAAVGTVIEAVLFRALFDAAGAALFAVIIALLASLLLLELPVAWGLRRAGRGDRGTVPRSVHAQDPTPRRPLFPEPPRVRHGRARAPGSQAARRCPRWRATSCARC